MEPLAFLSTLPSFADHSIATKSKESFLVHSGQLRISAQRRETGNASIATSAEFRLKRSFFGSSGRQLLLGSRTICNIPWVPLRNGPGANDTIEAAVKKTFSSFEDMLAGTEKPVLVDFYATWCGPCVMMAPILDEVSAAFKGDLMVVKLDTEVYPAIAAKYQVHALPTLILFKNGEPVDRIEGLVPADQLIPYLQPIIAA